MPALCSTRRHFLRASPFGLGAMALPWLLSRENLLAAPVKPDFDRVHDLAPRPPPGFGKARAMISLFMIGGPSQMDLCDPKPELTKRHLQPFPGEIKYDNAAEASKKVFGSPFRFAPRGQCGMEISDLMPGLASITDEITLIRSMRTGVSNHGQSMYALHAGRIVSGHPVLGSWLSYGLGSLSDELPAFVTLTDPRGPPLLQHDNWSAGYLPAVYQGTLLRPTDPRLLNLDPPAHLRGEPQKRQLEFLRELNEAHAAARPGESDLHARIKGFELAARMQTGAKEALDISGEPASVKTLYGIDQEVTRDWGTRCLIARRLVERGVRFVQVINNGQSWDHHGSLTKELPNRCREVDIPCAALVKDLRQRGLLDSTLVQWGGEMGRLPVLQNDTGPDKWGRDHNTYGFSIWMAGGGLRAGHVHGETDEWGHHAVKDVVTHRDYHATVLHLFGLDHTRLSYKRNGAELSLTNGEPARVVKEILA